MPGIFGVAGYDPGVREALREQFSLPWGSCESTAMPDGILGGHAFAPGRALHAMGDSHVAVDGEVGIYRDPASARGNVVTVRGDRWEIVTEWSGTFPLYYHHSERGLIFGSRLKPIACLIEARPDLVALRELLTYGYILAGRTSYEGIRRLLPGQSLAYDHAARKLAIGETSRAWVGTLEDVRPRELAETAWTTLSAALERSMPREGSVALMLSGGWDSRVLFAGLRGRPQGLFCYSHGDPRSREFDIIRRLRGTGTPHHEEPNRSAYDLDALRLGFDRVENVQFPDFHRAGRVLSNLGMGCVAAGVYGEVLGGRYGSTLVLPGIRKAAALVGHLFQRGEKARPAPEQHFLVSERKTPWYLDRDAWPASLGDGMRADVRSAFERLRDRGIGTDDQLLEAFITESRGTQYANAQLLSCRAFTDVAYPYTDRALLEFASRIPVAGKVHNLLNREMMLRRDPPLLDVSTAATLLPASWPILLQEGSRAGRRLYEQLRWELYFGTRGRVSEPRFGALNGEFLRECEFLEALAGDLRTGLWNMKAIRKRIADVRGMRNKIRSYLLVQRLLGAYSIDLMLR